MRHRLRGRNSPVLTDVEKLHVALRMKDFKGAKVLIEDNGVSVDSKDSNGTPAFCKVQPLINDGAFEIIRLMHEKGADFSTFCNGETYLFKLLRSTVRLCRKYEINPDYIKYVIQRSDVNAVDKNGKNGIHFILSEHHFGNADEIMIKTRKQLVEMLFDANMRIGRLDEDAHNWMLNNYKSELREMKSVRAILGTQKNFSENLLDEICECLLWKSAVQYFCKINKTQNRNGKRKFSNEIKERKIKKRI